MAEALHGRFGSDPPAPTEPARGRAGLSNHVDRSDLSAGAVVRAREPSTDVELWALDMPLQGTSSSTTGKALSGGEDVPAHGSSLHDAWWYTRHAVMITASKNASTISSL